MKGAFVVSSDMHVFDEARDALVRIGAKATEDDVVQLQDELGRLFTIYRSIDPSTDWEWREGPFISRADVEPPDMTKATACWVECRWEDLFASVMRRLAEALSTTAWVLDGDGVLWPASEVDPREVRL